MMPNNLSSIVVVSGLPRSGTSMMMQMLQAGGVPVLSDGLRTADEDNPRGYFELEVIKQLNVDKSWLSNAKGKAVKIIYRLIYDLPKDYDYLILFMERDITEVIKSQLSMLRRMGKPTANHDEKYFADLFSKDTQFLRNWLALRPNCRLLAVSYSQTITNPLASASRINYFLGGGLDIDSMAGAVDSRLYRQRLTYFEYGNKR